jgi:hypothetical protein
VYTFDYRLWSETAKGEEESASELSVWVYYYYVSVS